MVTIEYIPTQNMKIIQQEMLVFNPPVDIRHVMYYGFNTISVFGDKTISEIIKWYN